MQTWLRISILFLVLAGSLYISSSAGRADLGAFQGNSEALLVPISARQGLEQTFLSTHADMKAVHVFSRIHGQPDLGVSSITLALYAQNAGSENRIALQNIPLSSAAVQPRLTLQFPAEPRSRDQRYRLAVTTDAPEGLVSLFASREDAYTDGALWINGKPQPNDLAFEVDDAISLWNWYEDFHWFITTFFQGILLFLLFSVLGSSILVIFGKSPLTDLSEWLILSIACGIGFVPILFQVLSIFHWPVTTLLLRLMIPVMACLAGLKLAVIHQLRLVHLRFRMDLLWGWIKQQWLAGLLLLFFLLAWAIRIAQIRDLAVPSWIDGMTHLDLIERIVANQGIPGGVLYHTGYHSLVTVAQAIFAGKTGYEMLLVGQWVNALVCFSFYLLAQKILNDRLAALFGAGLLGFMAPFPTYLFNWGRYPFLLGLVMLGCAIPASLTAWRERSWKSIGIAVFLGIGMVLCHYGMMGFWITFSTVYVICWFFHQQPQIGLLRNKPKYPVRILVPLGLVLIGVIGFFAIRFPDLFASNQLSEIVSQSRIAAQGQDYQELVGIAFRGSGTIFGLLCLYGIGIAWIASRRTLVFSLGWLIAQAGLVAFLSPWFGESVASYTNWIIASSLPLALLGGVACAWLVRGNPPVNPNGKSRAARSEKLARFRPGYAFIPSLFLSIIFLGGGSYLIGQTNPATVIFTPADARAMNWILGNTPADAVFLINSFRWGGAEIVPADGGGWLQEETARAIVSWEAAPPSGNPISLFPRPWDYVYLGKGSGFLHLSDRDRLAIPTQIVYQEGGIIILQRTRP